MIKMAETRGLFGENMGESAMKRNQKTAKSKKKTSSAKVKKRTTFEVDRIAAQTHCSRLRSHDATAQHAVCPKNRMDENIVHNPARQWWAETTKYLTRLKRSLIRQKIISSRPNILNKLLPDKENVSQQLRNIDEVLKNVPKVEGTTANIPPFPRLRLTRPTVKQERIPFPVYNCSVELPGTSYYS